MLEYKLAILIARSHDLSDAIELDQVVADLQSLKSDVLDEAFSDRKSSLSSQITSAHAQIIKSLTVCENRNQGFGKVEEC